MSVQVVYDRKFYDNQRSNSSRGANQIVPYLIDLVKPNSVLDVGCGIGTWVTCFLEQEIPDCIGMDGPWAKSAGLLIDQDIFVEADLNNPPNIGRDFDLTISLEVAEHLPDSSSKKFIDYLCSTAPAVAFSAAIPFQGGIDHINEQWPDYWIKLFEKNHFKCLDLIRPLYWDNSDTPYYYAQNCFLFVRSNFEPLVSHLEEKASSLCKFPTRAVHPRKYLEAASLSNVGLKPVLRSLPGAVWRAIKRRI